MNRLFSYAAIDAKGELSSGTISACSEADAIQQLRSQGLYPTQITHSHSTEQVLDVPQLQELAEKAAACKEQHRIDAQVEAVRSKLTIAAGRGENTVWAGFTPLSLDPAARLKLRKHGFKVGLFSVSF